MVRVVLNTPDEAAYINVDFNMGIQETIYIQVQIQTRTDKGCTKTEG